MINEENENFNELPPPEDNDEVNSTTDEIEVQDTTLNDGDGNKKEEQNLPEENKQQPEQNSISADLIRGHINTIILRALYERDKYGYEIINDIESKSHGQYILKQPTLYSALKRLENQGYIKAYWKTDEVTLGGRRKYFTLTESGKEITEKNLAEWEYSRTIIDSLISDKSFDFANPAPTPVDFKLLRDSVSRVPTVKQEPTQLQEQQVEPTAQQIISQHEVKTVNSASFVQNIEYTQPYADKTESTQQAEQQEKSNEEIIKQIPNEKPVVIEEKVESPEEAARRRTHENYLRLISEPVKTPTPTENVVPGYEEINSNKLIYNNKPETERDYKNLIDGIFFKTIDHGSVQTNYHSRQAEKSRYSSARQSANNEKLVDRGTNDGVSITPSNETSSSRATKTTYNKGLTLLKCSAIVLALLIIESIFCYAFMGTLSVTWVYPTVILAIGIIQFVIFLIMTLNGYNKNCVRPTSNGYISTCIILTIILVLIISMLSFLFNMNTKVLSDVFTMLIIPSITALSIIVFAISFKLFLK